MSFRNFIAIVTSPRPRVGENPAGADCSLIVHLAEGRSVAAFDLDAGEGTLAQFLPKHVTRSVIDDLNGEMALFDRLMAEDGAAKMVRRWSSVV